MSAIASPVAAQLPAGAEKVGAPAKQRRADFNYAINGFRGVCVLFVFFYHLWHAQLLTLPPSALERAVDFLLGSLRYGVELFFMISGYVIVSSLKRHRTVSGFLWDRFSRIFPVWTPIHVALFTAGAVFGLKEFAGTDAFQKVQIFWGNLFFISPLLNQIGTHAASWSLGYEWLFYLFAAAAAAVYKASAFIPRPPRFASWSFWAMGIVALLVLLPRALFFLPGVAVALTEPALKRHAQWLRWPALSLLLCLVAWRCIDLDYAHAGAYPLATVYGGANFLFTTTALLAGFHAFSSICVCDERQRVLRTRLMQLLGNVSYSFYLWHPIIMFVTKRLAYALVVPRLGVPAGFVFFALSSFAVALAVSYLSYRLLEIKVAKAVRHFFDRGGKGDARARATASAVSVDGIRAVES